MAKVDSLALENFRGIARCELHGLAPINLFIGRNNSGKSSVVEALARGLAYVVPQGQDVRGRTISGVWEQERGEPASHGDLVRAGAASAAVSLAGLVAANLRILRHGDSVRLEPHPRQSPDTFGFGEYLPGLDARDAQVEKMLWPRLLATREDRALADHLTTLFGTTVESLQLFDGDLMVVGKEQGLRLRVHGSGVRAALRMLMTVAAVRDGVMVIEELEAFQHPRSLEQLTAIVTRAQAERPVQFFVTTHSLECVRAFARAAVEVASGDESKSPLAVWYLSPDAAGVIEPRRLTASMGLGLDELGTDVRCLDEMR